MRASTKLLGILLAAIGIAIAAFLLVRAWQGSDAAAPSAGGSQVPAPPAAGLEPSLLAEPGVLSPEEGGSRQAAGVEIEQPTTERETAVLVEVRTVEDDRPVADVLVELRVESSDAIDKQSSERKTDAEGRARFALLHGTQVTSLSVDPGPLTTGALQWAQRSVATGSEERMLIRVSSGGSVAGTVRDEQGRPVPGAAVQGWCRYLQWSAPYPLPAPDRETAADSAGRFRVEHLGEFFVLAASAPGMVPAGRLTGRLDPGQELAGVGLVLALEQAIEGRVVDPSRSPIAGVEVRALSTWTPEDPDPASVAGQTRVGPPDSTATSRSDGGFVLAGLVPHPYLVIVDQKGFEPWRETREPADGFLEIVLGHGLELTGWVLGADGKGLSGAYVRLLFTTREARTDEQGFFRIGGLTRNAAATLGVSAPAHAIQVIQPLEIRDDQKNEVTVRLEPERVIAGRVVDVRGRGVAEAAVELEGDRIASPGMGGMSPVPTWEWMLKVNATRTDAEGRFRLERLYAGKFLVTATHPEDAELKAVETVASGIEDLILKLDPQEVVDVRLVGRVTDAATKAPVTSFEVQPWSMEPGWGHVLGLTVEDVDGEYEFTGLRPGKIRLWFDAPGYAHGMVPEREYAPGEHRVDLELFPARDLAVRLMGRDRLPLAGAVLWVSAPGASSQMFRVEGQPYRSGHATLDSRGEARVHGLPAGPVTLKFGGFLAKENPRFDLDLTFPLEGIQEFVIDAERPRELRLSLLSALPGANGGRIVEVTSSEHWRDLVDGRKETEPLAAPSFNLEVRDEKGELCASASGERNAGGGWKGRWTRGNSTSGGDMSAPPSFGLLVPSGILDIDVQAEGHRPLHLRLAPEDLAPRSESTLRWAIVLER